MDASKGSNLHTLHFDSHIEIEAGFWVNCIKVKQFALKAELRQPSPLLCADTLPANCMKSVEIVKTNNLALYCYLLVAAAS